MWLVLVTCVCSCRCAISLLLTQRRATTSFISVHWTATLHAWFPGSWCPHIVHDTSLLVHQLSLSDFCCPVTCTNVLIFNRSSLHSYSHSFWRCFQLLSLAQAGRLKTLDWKRRHWTAEGHEKCETRKPGTKNPKLHGERRVWTDMLLYLLLLFVFTHKCCTIYIWAEFISQYEYIRPML